MNPIEALGEWLAKIPPNDVFQAIVGVVGIALGFGLSQWSKAGESKRAIRQGRLNSISERRRVAFEEAVGMAVSWERGRNSNTWQHAPNQIAGLRDKFLMTGRIDDQLAGAALGRFLSVLDAKVAARSDQTLGEIDGIRMLHFPAPQPEKWHPFVVELILAGGKWIEERRSAEWMGIQVDDITRRMTPVPIKMGTDLLPIRAGDFEELMSHRAIPENEDNQRFEN